MAKLKKKDIEALAVAFSEGSEAGAYPDSHDPEAQKVIACFFFDCLNAASLIDDGDFEDFMEAIGLDPEMD